MIESYMNDGLLEGALNKPATPSKASMDKWTSQMKGKGEKMICMNHYAGQKTQDRKEADKTFAEGFRG